MNGILDDRVPGIADKLQAFLHVVDTVLAFAVVSIARQNLADVVPGDVDLMIEKVERISSSIVFLPYASGCSGTLAVFWPPTAEPGRQNPDRPDPPIEIIQRQGL